MAGDQRGAERGDPLEWVPWLSQTLRAEQEQLAEQLHQAVQAQLEEHWRAISSAVALRLEAGDAAPAVHCLDLAAAIPEADCIDLTAASPEVDNLEVEGGALDEVHPPVGAIALATDDPPAPARFLQRVEAQISRRMPGWLRDQAGREAHFFHESCEQLKQRIADGQRGPGALGTQSTFQSASPLRSKDTTCFSRFVRSHTFEWFSGLAIVACTGVMIIEVNVASLDSGFLLRVEGYDAPAKERSPGAAEALLVLNTAFNVVFLVELLMRIAAYGHECFWSGWIWFDGSCLLLAWLDFVGSLLPGGMDPMIFRVARIARLARLLQALRVESGEYLVTMYLLVRSLQASLGAMFWSFVLLLCAQVVAGILLCQLLRDFIDDVENGDNEDVRLQVFEHFGTFMNAMLTMFEVTLANWVPVCRLLYTHVHHSYGLFFIVYRGCFMFALIRVISAVFLAETARCANADDALAVQKQQRQKDVYCRKLNSIFAGLDSSHDGRLSRDELIPLMSDDVLRTWLATLEINVEDLDYLFDILESGDQQIDIKTFTSGMGRIKGPAKSIDMLKLHNDTLVLDRKLDAVLAEVRRAPPGACSPRSPPGDFADGTVKPRRKLGLELDPLFTI